MNVSRTGIVMTEGICVMSSRGIGKCIISKLSQFILEQPNPTPQVKFRSWDIQKKEVRKDFEETVKNETKKRLNQENQEQTKKSKD